MTSLIPPNDAGCGRRRYGGGVAVVELFRSLRGQRRTVAFDVLLALALTALVQLDVWTGEGDDQTFANKPFSSTVLLAATLPTVARRAAPLHVALAYSAAAAVQALVTQTFTSSPGLFFTGLVVLYSLGTYAERRDALVGLALVALAIGIREYYGFPRTELDHWNAAVFYVLLLLAFLAGVYVRSRRRSDALEREAERLRREREQQERAVAEERARIARELHDVVAHNVSATVVQAEAAEEVLGEQPESARRSLEQIQHSGREALGEMRRLLGVMRSHDDEGRLTPQPRLADLQRLVDDARAADMPVTLTVEGERRELPPGIELSAYRIVQEALTNVRKHAGRPVSADVLLRYEEAALSLEITDDGYGARAQDGHGLGLIGMRERVAFFGGDFSAEPAAERGFVVRARFPLPSVER